VVSVDGIGHFVQSKASNYFGNVVAFDLIMSTADIIQPYCTFYLVLSSGNGSFHVSITDPSVSGEAATAGYKKLEHDVDDTVNLLLAPNTLHI
jgi:hypothetical protein